MIFMEQIMNYVKPELLILTVVLYFVGVGLKKAQAVKDKYIPMINGAIGIGLCMIWVFADMFMRYAAGRCNGGIYSHHTGNSCGRTEHICESGN